MQAQVLDLLDELQRQTGIAIIFITHDLRVAAQICDDVLVMQRGQVVEQGPASTVLHRPQHDYTRALIDAAPGRFWISQPASRWLPEGEPTMPLIQFIEDRAPELRAVFQDLHANPSLASRKPMPRPWSRSC